MKVYDVTSLIVKQKKNVKDDSILKEMKGRLA